MSHAIRNLALALSLCFLGASATGCIVHTKPGHSRHHVKRSGKHKHRHCHNKGKRDHKKRHKVCHSHQHRHPHH